MVRSFLPLLCLAACTQGSPSGGSTPPGSPLSVAKGGDGALTDAQVVKYIAAYENLKKVAPALAEKHKTDDGSQVQAGQEGYAVVEKAITDAGLSGYPEFVRVNAKIAWAFNTAQGQAFLTRFDGMMSDGEKQLQQALDDPQTPEATKAELRKQREVLRAEYAKNKKWADVAMTVANKLTDQDSLDVVLRHRAELEKAYRGF